MIKGKNILSFISWYAVSLGLVFIFVALFMSGYPDSNTMRLDDQGEYMKTKDIRINKELIMRYNPCLEGLDNFNKHYTDISIKELINSENISYDHKVWLLKHIVPTDLLVLWAIDSSFAAYEYSATANRAAYYAEQAAYYAAYNDDYYAEYVAYNAVRAANAANAAANAALSATATATYAYRYDGISVHDAQDERLQSLLYFIENED